MVTATKATPPARPSRPSIRLRALTTPTIQSSVNGRLIQPSAIGSPNGIGQRLDPEAEPVEEAGDEKLNHELSDRAGAFEVVVEPQQRDGDAAHEKADRAAAVGHEHPADVRVKEQQPH